MKTRFLLYILLMMLFFSACAHTYYKDYKEADKALVKHNENNIFN